MLVPATRIQMVTCTYHLSPEHHYKKNQDIFFFTYINSVPNKEAPLHKGIIISRNTDIWYHNQDTVLLLLLFPGTTHTHTGGRV